jgi:hypothetical protein
VALPIFPYFYFYFFNVDHHGLKLEADHEADLVLELRSEAIIFFLGSIAAASASSPPPSASSACGRDG